MFSTSEIIFFCIFFAVIAGFAAGYLGAVAKNMALARDVTDHSYRLEDLEGKLIRETKIRAQERSMKTRDLDKEIIALAQSSDAKPASPSLDEWRKKAFLRS